MCFQMQTYPDVCQEKKGQLKQSLSNRVVSDQLIELHQYLQVFLRIIHHSYLEMSFQPLIMTGLTPFPCKPHSGYTVAEGLQWFRNTAHSHLLRDYRLLPFPPVHTS